MTTKDWPRVGGGTQYGPARWADSPAPQAVASFHGPANGFSVEALLAHSVLNRLNRGVVIFDSCGHVQFANESAGRIAARKTAILINERRLRFVDFAAQAALLAYLRGVDDGVRGPKRRQPIVMAVPSRNCAGPYRLLISALATVELPSDADISWHVLMIHEPQGPRRVPELILRELYALTSAEAHLAGRLFEGDSMEAAARRLHVSINTAKCHLRHVFAKCDVHSQGELLQLLALGPRGF